MQWVIGLVGVAVGAILAFSLGQVSRYLQNKREDNLRWHHQRLDAYAGFTHAANKLIMLLNSAADASTVRRIKPESLLDPLSSALDDAMKAQALVRLVGQQATIDRADELLLRLKDANDSLQSYANVDVDRPAFAKRINAVFDRRADFTAAARRELHRDPAA